MHGTDGLYSGDVVIHDDPHTVHVTLMLASRFGPFKNQFAAVASTQRPEYIAFLVCANPRVPILPRTVYVNKNAYESEEHGGLHWGPGHLGVAHGMLEGVRSGVLNRDQAEDLLCIAVVWIWATATDVNRVYTRTSEATLEALVQAMNQTPNLDAIETHIRERGLSNPYYTVPPAPTPPNS